MSRSGALSPAAAKKDAIYPTNYPQASRFAVFCSGMASVELTIFYRILARKMKLLVYHGYCMLDIYKRQIIMLIIMKLKKRKGKDGLYSDH